MQKTKHEQSRFTLLELVLVVIILGVLASLALPRFLNMIHMTNAAEALENIGAIRQAISVCQHSGKYSCHINTKPGKYSNTLIISSPSDAPSSKFYYYGYGSGMGLAHVYAIYKKDVDQGNYDSYVAISDKDDPDGDTVTCGAGVFLPLHQAEPSEDCHV